MAKLSQSEALRTSAGSQHRSTPSGSGVLFGVPLGDLGWFSSLLMGLATGFIAFFASTFLAIISILCLNTFAHRTIDFGISYRRIGFPFGVAVAAIALIYLGSLWLRRKGRRA